MSRLKSKLIKKIVTITTVAVAACSDANLPSAPIVEAPAFNKVGQTVAAAKRANQQAADATVTATIGAKGGTLSAAGVTLSIPAGALSSATPITMTVSAGDYYQVHFQPHGLQFRKAADLTFTTDRGISGAFVAYFDTMAADGSVKVLEALAASQDGATIGAKLGHFSGYCVAVD